MKSLENLKAWLGEGEDYQWWVFPSVNKPRIVISLDKIHWNSALSLINPRKRKLFKLLLWFSKLRGKKPDIKGSLDSKLALFIVDRVKYDMKGLAVYVGTESIFKKYTVQLQNKEGKQVAYVKIADAKKSFESIDAENKALLKMAKYLGEENFFPRILASDKGVSIQTCPKNITDQPASQEQVTHFIDRLSIVSPVQIGWDDSPVRKFLIESLANLLNEQEVLEVIENGIRFLDNKNWDAVDHHYMHGDFVAWNMKGGGEGLLYDWEWAGLNVKYHDFFHYIWFPIIQKAEGAIGELCKAELIAKSDALLESRTKLADLAKYGLVYALWRLAFYSESCVANGDAPLDYPFINNLKDLCVQMIKNER